MLTVLRSKDCPIKDGHNVICHQYITYSSDCVTKKDFIIFLECLINLIFEKSDSFQGQTKQAYKS